MSARIRIKLFIAALLTVSIANGQTPKDRWIDSVFSTLDVDAKIGQMFFFRVSTASDEAELRNRIEESAVGGLIYSTSILKDKARKISRLQSASKIPMLIGIAGSPDAQIQLDTILNFPSPLLQSALRNDSLIYELGREVGREMKIFGIHAYLIPVNDSKNFANLSYGESQAAATPKTALWINGLRSRNIVSFAQHFPVKGIRVTEGEKHSTVVQVTEDSTQAYPFIQLFPTLHGIIPGAADLPLFFENKKMARKNKFSSAALTSANAGQYIRRKHGFPGLLVVDVSAMIRTTRKLPAGEAELLAFRSGNEVLISPANITAAVRRIRKLIKKEKQFETHLNESVRKILALKFDAGIADNSKTDQRQVVNNESALKLKQTLYHSAVTVVSNEKLVLPIQALEQKQFIALSTVRNNKAATFSKNLSRYATVSSLELNEKTDSLALKLRHGRVVIIASVFPETTDATVMNLLNLIKDPDSLRQVVVCDFGNETIRKFASEIPTLITSYTDDDELIEAVPQIIFGALPAKGVLPVSFGDIAAGSFVETKTLSRLSYSFPEDVGMDPMTLRRIEGIAREAIDMGATPGCHVLVARYGKIVYEKSFGHLTYEKQTAVSDETIYDLASITKVAATLQAVMFIHDRGLIDINKKASVYLPELKNSNKKDFTIKDILTHQAGLWPFLLFWPQTMADSIVTNYYYSQTPTATHPYIVSEKLYTSSAMKDSLWTWIVNAKIREKAERTPFDFRYSDMGFYIMQHLAEKMLNQPIEDFLEQNFYEPLGASRLGYLPLTRFPANQIAPTENDVQFRKSLLIGTVHDQGAAMHGGVAGHAGLFGSALDLAKLGQMLLQEGYYGGTQYYKPETVRLFSQKQYVSNRRGLGWEKPAFGNWNSPTSFYASARTYGHTGFTGTCIWIDPEFELVYIFLSNRVHPDMTNNKLLNANIRTRIQEVLYKSIFEYCKTAGFGNDLEQIEVITPAGDTSQ